MYEELTERLREVAEEVDNDYDVDPYNAEQRCLSILEAANAIEELSSAGSIYGKAWTFGYDAGRSENMPHWISVTDQLPFAESGDASKEVMVTDGKRVLLAQWFNFEESEPHWSYTDLKQNITHWMPLPEPPKEET